MKKELLFVLLLLTTFVANAQEAPAGHYMFKGFQQGIGKIRHGMPIQDNFNYDVVKQEMHFLDGTEELKLDMPGLDTLFINKRKFVPSGTKFAESIRLENGIELLIYWHSKEQEKGRVGANGLTTTAGGVYSLRVGDTIDQHAYQDYEENDINVYTYISQNTYVAKVKKKSMKFTDAKSFAKAFKMDASEVKATMEKNNWSFQNAADVVSLLNSMEFE